MSFANLSSPCDVATSVGLMGTHGGATPLPHIHAGLNKYSARITQPKSQGASQAMLYATGLKEADMNKPQVTCCAGQ